MNPFEMVVIIIAIVTVGSIIKARVQARNGIIEDVDGIQRPIVDPDGARMREEVKGLKERIAVLERLVTDEHGPRQLDREIEKLR